ncbi:MAG TPA: hypothetical protein VFT48_14100 [Pyrinomonadaceae bacterium]|nr:hypothetical protein [Pyrinomonadaceae bacterium]
MSGTAKTFLLSNQPAFVAAHGSWFNKIHEIDSNPFALASSCFSAVFAGHVEGRWDCDDVNANLVAFKAGVGPGMKIVAVNGRAIGAVIKSRAQAVS